MNRHKNVTEKKHN